MRKHTGTDKYIDVLLTLDEIEELLNYIHFAVLCGRVHYDSLEMLEHLQEKYLLGAYGTNEDVRAARDVVLEIDGNLDPVIIQGLIHHHNTSE